jgi:hypothetical protein
VPTLGLKGVEIAEGDKDAWKDGSYVRAVVGITGASRDVDWVTFDVGSGSYCFKLTGR